MPLAFPGGVGPGVDGNSRWWWWNGRMQVMGEGYEVFRDFCVTRGESLCVADRAVPLVYTATVLPMRFTRY